MSYLWWRHDVDFHVKVLGLDQQGRYGLFVGEEQINILRSPDGSNKVDLLGAVDLDGPEPEAVGRLFLALFVLLGWINRDEKLKSIDNSTDFRHPCTTRAHREDGARLWVHVKSSCESLGEPSVQIQVLVDDEAVDLTGDTSDIIDLSPVKFAENEYASALSSPKKKPLLHAHDTYLNPTK